MGLKVGFGKFNCDILRFFFSSQIPEHFFFRTKNPAEMSLVNGCEWFDSAFTSPDTRKKVFNHTIDFAGMNLFQNQHLWNLMLFFSTCGGVEGPRFSCLEVAKDVNPQKPQG